ncbi:hypothetical protein J2W40_003470 [Sphingobium xenophagum]|uniref:Uncharacterized protein n=1 Tax=Sphingobium xenophagum TaxID=121428 RepID=A0ABU1X4V6_SPHXE|nr:hypothetical protein [Sphingobium xenophagum]
MRKCLLIAALLVALPRPASAAPDHHGHYYLQGVMETGSELLLRDDGGFQWYLVVGALDLFAEGEWTATADAVVLTARKSKVAPNPAFDTLVLQVEDGRLVPPDGQGAYVRATQSGD